MTTLQIGRLLRASTTGCVVGCRVTQINAPAFGGMVRIPLDAGLETQVYGLVYDIHIDDDGLVRQLITAEGVPEDVIQDNRVNRNVPVEVSVLFTGFRKMGASFTCFRRARRSRWMRSICATRGTCASSPALGASDTFAIS
jgi:hypothetical protein